MGLQPVMLLSNREIEGKNTRVQIVVLAYSHSGNVINPAILPRAEIDSDRDRQAFPLCITIVLISWFQRLMETEAKPSFNEPHLSHNPIFIANVRTQTQTQFNSKFSNGMVTSLILELIMSTMSVPVALSSILFSNHSERIHRQLVEL